MNRDERWPRWHGISWHQVGDDDPEARDQRRVTTPTVNIFTVSVKKCSALMYGTYDVECTPVMPRCKIV